MIRKASFGSIRLSLHISSCVVSDPPTSLLSIGEGGHHGGRRSGDPGTSLALVVPTNETLTSTSKFGYFSTGGRPPADGGSKASTQSWAPPGFVSSWGGMEIGPGMSYATQTVDGVVSLLGGAEYKAELAELRARAAPLLPRGSAVSMTGRFGKLPFDELVHCSVPFNDCSDASSLLSACWLASLRSASAPLICTPLIGAGCRGFANEVAAEAACLAVREWAEEEREKEAEREVAVVVMSEEVGRVLAASWDDLITTE